MPSLGRALWFSHGQPVAFQTSLLPTSSLHSPPLPSHWPCCTPYAPELGPRLGGLVDVTLVQWVLLTCLLAQGLMELELQDKTHEVPAGTGQALGRVVGKPSPRHHSAPDPAEARPHGPPWGRRENPPCSRKRPTEIPGPWGDAQKSVGISPGEGEEQCDGTGWEEGHSYLMYGVTFGT